MLNRSFRKKRILVNLINRNRNRNKQKQIIIITIKIKTIIKPNKLTQ